MYLSTNDVYSLIALAIRVLQEVKDLDIHDDDASLITHHHFTLSTLLLGPSRDPDHQTGAFWAALSGQLAIPGGLASTKLRTPIPRKQNTKELKVLSSSFVVFVVALHTKYKEIARGVSKPCWAIRNTFFDRSLLSYVGFLASCWRLGFVLDRSGSHFGGLIS